MSASKDKILRKQQIEAGTDKRTLAAEKAAKEQRRSRIRYIAVAVVLVIAFAFIFIYNSTYPAKHTIAVTIGDRDYTVAETNYYYSAAFNSFYNSNYYYVSSGMFFNLNDSLANQAFSEDMTWRDYFLDTAIDTMQQVQILSGAAEEAGYTLPEDEQATFDEAIDAIGVNWGDYGYSSQQQYLNLSYGRGVTMDLIERELYRSTLANSYAVYLEGSYEYTNEELDSYYAEHADEYDTVSYAYYGVYDDSMDPDAIAAAVDGTSLEEFNAYMDETYDGAQPMSASNLGSELNQTYADWLLDSARQPGDATVATDDTNSVSFVVMFLDREDNSYLMPSFRHILIMAEDTDGDGVYSDEEMAASDARAQEIYEQWLDGDATEDSFAELATEYTEDSGSAEGGGLYEDVYKGEMVESINDWLFDEARQPGDTVIVSNNGSYAGTHIVYYVGQSEQTYAQHLADSDMRSTEFNDWLTAAEEDYPITRRHLKQCGRNR